MKPSLQSDDAGPGGCGPEGWFAARGGDAVQAVGMIAFPFTRIPP
jgi:hypothetical protein